MESEGWAGEEVAETLAEGVLLVLGGIDEVDEGGDEWTVVDGVSTVSFAGWAEIGRLHNSSNVVQVQRVAPIAGIV